MKLQRFELVFDGSTTSVLSETIQSAIACRAAKHAPVGAELRDGEGTVLATRERVHLAEGWIDAWLPTDAWAGEDAPLNLEQLRSVLEDQGPVFRLIAGGAKEKAMTTNLELQVETYQELEFAPDVEIDRDVVALRDPESGKLFAAPRALFTVESSGVLATSTEAVVNG